MIAEKKIVGLFIIMSMLFVPGNGQEKRSKMKMDCVTVRMIEQKPAPKIEGEPAPDVFVAIPDDLHLRFELKNNCDRTIYYLAFNLPDESKMPAGFVIYRDEGKEWKARTPAWRREGSLTDPLSYHWVPIEPHKFIEFEYSDLSKISGERSVAIYVNFSPVQENRIEILAEPFTVKSIQK